MSISPSSASAPTRVAVIVPTLNEVENIDELLTAVLAQSGPTLALEVIVVDDGSKDGTQERVREWEAKAPVRLLVRDATDGLIGAVVEGSRLATTEIVVVMDADLSHPPQRIPDLVRPIIDGEKDMVIGSRYVAGGATPGWPLRRRFISRVASALAWPLTDVHDSLSGFFAVRRDRVLAVETDAAGFKIALEILVRGGESLRVAEVPIAFVDRTRGHVEDERGHHPDVSAAPAGVFRRRSGSHARGAGALDRRGGVPHGFHRLSADDERGDAAGHRAHREFCGGQRGELRAQGAAPAGTGALQESVGLAGSLAARAADGALPARRRARIARDRLGLAAGLGDCRRPSRPARR